MSLLQWVEPIVAFGPARLGRPNSYGLWAQCKIRSADGEEAGKVLSGSEPRRCGSRLGA
jgi:hypothetical protein